MAMTTADFHLLAQAVYATKSVNSSESVAEQWEKTTHRIASALRTEYNGDYFNRQQFINECYSGQTFRTHGAS